MNQKLLELYTRVIEESESQRSQLVPFIADLIVSGNHVELRDLLEQEDTANLLTEDEKEFIRETIRKLLGTSYMN